MLVGTVSCKSLATALGAMSGSILSTMAANMLENPSVAVLMLETFKASCDEVSERWKSSMIAPR